MKKSLPFVLFVIFILCSEMGYAQYDGKREWRAVWVATVNNMDWPSAQNLTAAQQQAELIAYFDLFKELGFNAVVFQVRPTADAFYLSKLEPWSLYLTGKQGQAPDPLYDPLALAVEEAHKRGMELHAWLNPYRLTQDIKNLEEVAPGHIYRQHPEWFIPHGKKSYFDPALPQTRDFLCNVVGDILHRYDVDGIHMDDYFYPGSDFNDEASFAADPRGYSEERKGDWRRENVNMVIKQLQDTIKAVKPYVKFGISPYAVWRNKREDPRGSDSQSYSYTNYDHLYADVLKWMENKWMDYVLPQLYFHIGYPRADFITLANWWADNCNGLPVYAGLATYRLNARANDEAWRSPREIVNQIEYIRKQPSYFGVCYFNAKNFKDNVLGINEVLKSIYTHPALPPALPGFETRTPDAPQKVKLTVKNGQAGISWSAPKAKKQDAGAAKYYAVYRFQKGTTPDFSKGSAIVWLGGVHTYSIPANSISSYDYYVTALDRLFNESKAVRIK